MAQKRMFSLQIVDSDAFLEMPASTQSLYFHLCMRADDDGFVSNPKKIMKIVNSSDDDIKVLFSKRFIIGFETGIIVIKHWKIHNYIAKDRYKETVYLDEKNKLITKENGVYTECIQNEGEMLTQIRLDKISIDKNRIEEKSIYGEYKNIKLNKEEYNKLVNKYNVDNTNILIEFLSSYKQEKSYKTKSDYLTILRWVVDACKIKTNIKNPNLEVIE
jgi:hypothetical protein